MAAGGFLHLGSDIIGQSADAFTDIVTQTINLASNKIQPVPLILTLLQAEDPVGSETPSE